MNDLNREKPLLPPLKRIGDNCDGWVLLLPVIVYDQSEEWLAIDKGRRTAIVAFFRECCDDNEHAHILGFVSDIEYYLNNRRLSMSEMRPHLPGSASRYEFNRLATMHGGVPTHDHHPHLSACWHDRQELMYIFYGRMLEKVNNPNDVILVPPDSVVLKNAASGDD